jgi:hypothetical protein
LVRNIYSTEGVGQQWDEETLRRGHTTLCLRETERRQEGSMEDWAERRCGPMMGNMAQ